MDARLLALALAVGGAARAAVTLPSDSGTPWKDLADRLHSTVIEVHGQLSPESVSYGTGVLIGNRLAVTTLHAVAVPSRIVRRATSISIFFNGGLSIVRRR